MFKIFITNFSRLHIKRIVRVGTMFAKDLKRENVESGGKPYILRIGDRTDKKMGEETISASSLPRSKAGSDVRIRIRATSAPTMTSQHHRNNDDDDDYEDLKYNSMRSTPGRISQDGQQAALYHDLEMMPVPNPTRFDRIYISGPTGSGKTTWIGKYLDMLLEIQPNRKIIVFSDVALENDNILSKYPHVRIKLDEQLVEDPIEMAELNGSVVIADDIDSITNSKVKKAVFSMIDSILKQGSSKQKITLIVTNHAFSDYQNTRNIIINCNFIVWFKGTPNLEYSLTRIGLDRKQIDTTTLLPGRYVCVHKNFPRYVVYTSGAYLL